eukprot:TRINITY_DN901_c0_g2_i2.p1 TRINITY_DN901_c0_g2~~TRINITY_DN901_c0_g2_i2.p1  ORF type:complete len:588 (+),score=176.37 TRINITY_DN901_c0_g2_i2:80-1765(+)
MAASDEAGLGYLQEHDVHTLVDKAVSALVKERPRDPLPWLAACLRRAGEADLPGATAYLRENGVGDTLDRAITELIKERPPEPADWLADYVQRAAAARGPCGDPADAAAVAAEVAEAGADALLPTATETLGESTVELLEAPELPPPPPPPSPPRPAEPVQEQMLRGQSFIAHWMAGMQRYRLEVTEQGALCEVRAGPSEGSALRGTKREYDGVAVDKVQDGWLRLAEGTGWVRKHGPLWRWVPMGTEAGLMPRGGTQVPGGFRVGQRVCSAVSDSAEATPTGEVIGPGEGSGEQVRVRWDSGAEADVQYDAIELYDSAVQRAPTMVWDSQKGHLVPPQDEGDAGKYTVVFDLDETLIFARRGPLFARPGIAAMLELLQGRAEVIVWTAGMRGYAQAILRQIDPHGVVRHCVYRHPQWHALGSSAQRKDLAALGRDLDRTLIVENSADSIRGDEANAVLLSDYEATEAEDRTLPALTTLLRHLLVAQRPVPAFLAETELLSRREVACERGGVKITAWVLDPARASLDAVDKDMTSSALAAPLDAPALPPELTVDGASGDRVG